MTNTQQNLDTQRNSSYYLSKGIFIGSGKKKSVSLSEEFAQEGMPRSKHITYAICPKTRKTMFYDAVISNGDTGLERYQSDMIKDTHRLVETQETPIVLGTLKLDPRGATRKSGFSVRNDEAMSRDILEQALKDTYTKLGWENVDFHVKEALKQADTAIKLAREVSGKPAETQQKKKVFGFLNS